MLRLVGLGVVDIEALCRMRLRLHLRCRRSHIIYVALPISISQTLEFVYCTQCNTLLFRNTTLLPFTSQSSCVSPVHSASIWNLAMRRASFLRSLALRCSLTASAVPVTVGMEAMDRRPRTILCVCMRSRGCACLRVVWVTALL